MRAALDSNKQRKRNVNLGDCFLIPDIVTAFGNNGKSHPWIVKDIHQNVAVICPRTTKLNKSNQERGTSLPADTLLGFSKPGVILKDLETTIPCKELSLHKYVGNIRWRLVRAHFF